MLLLLELLLLLLHVLYHVYTPSSIGLIPNAENRNLEIANLEVLGRLEHQTLVGEKIQEAIFRALRDTEIPNTGCFRAQAFGTPTAAWGTSLGSIFLAGLWNTGTPNTG